MARLMKEYPAFETSLLAGTVQARMNHNVLETGVARDPLSVSFHGELGTFAVQPIRLAGSQLVNLVSKLAWQF